MLNSYQRTRLLLLTGAALSFVLFYYAGGLFAVPAERGFQMSLMQQPAVIVDFVLVAVVLLACTLLSTLIAGRVRFDAGLFAACLGLIALSVRGGPMRSVLQAAQSPAIYIGLAVELVLLYALIGGAWRVLWMLHHRGWLELDVVRDGVQDEAHPVPNCLFALLVQAGVMGAVLTLLAQTDAKQQVLASVGLAAFIGAAAAHSALPVRPSIWFWMGPLIVGIVGYLAAYANPEGWLIGQVTGTLAPLARPLPLDYASAGTAGAILGYWMSRRWLRAREAEQASA